MGSPHATRASEDDDTIPLSALEHHAYCPRQAALIHVEGTYADDARTVLGSIAHQAVEPGSMTRRRNRDGSVVITSMPVASETLGMFGYCDTVEFPIPGDLTVAVPVEHKVGRYQPDGPATVQVVAQAICLEEAGLSVPHAYVYTYFDDTRHMVELTPDRRDRVTRIVTDVRRTWANHELPPALSDSRCRACSLKETCLPWAHLTSGHQDA